MVPRHNSLFNSARFVRKNGVPIFFVQLLLLRSLRFESQRKLWNAGETCAGLQHPHRERLLLLRLLRLHRRLDRHEG